MDPFSFFFLIGIGLQRHCKFTCTAHLTTVCGMRGTRILGNQANLMGILEALSISIDPKPQVDIYYM